MSEMEIMGRAQGNGVIGGAEEASAIADVQAKMVLAKRFPRDVERCRKMIELECNRPELAEKATYEYKRGDTVVRGASIRLVECVSRYWGNILCGIKEIERNPRSATVRAYAWDLETNFADEKVFEVDLKRETKKNGVIWLTDSRDQYEMIANMGARRKRACIQAVIPQFIIDEAVKTCQNTLANEYGNVGIDVTRAKMLAAFKALADWVTEEDLAAICGKSDYNTINAKDIVKCRNLYNAISDGFVKIKDAFGKDSTPDAAETDSDALNEVNDILSGGKDK